MSAPFVKLLRGPDTEKMLAEHPNCFLVLTLIALRARREVPSFNPNGLQKGEAMVGDYAAAGLERQPFRTALANLQRWGLITSRATSKGTIVKLTETALYDINFADSNQQTNQQVTTNPTSNQPAANQQLTTNKNVKNEIKEEGRKEGPASQPFSASQGDPNKFPADEAKVFATLANFSALVTTQNFGHIDKGFYLPEIQRKAMLTKQLRDETGWENYLLDFLKRESAKGELLTRELNGKPVHVPAPFPADPRSLWGF